MMPVFMIGTQRSGSNLLRLMINQVPEVAAPHPPHILQRMMPLLPLYGNVSDPRVFYQLVDDVCRLVELNPVPWEGVTLNRHDVAQRCFALNLVAVHGAVYDVYAEARGAKTWCCKSLANINYIKEIEAYFRKPKYIYLYRDGRDVAVSFRKAVVGEKHYYHIAKEWAATQEIALNLRNKIEPSRFLSVRYEDLTGQPESVAKNICTFLALPTCPVMAMLDYHKTGEAQRAATASGLWGNVTKPVMKDNTRKFMREASIQDISIFESVAGHILDTLGYERVLIKKGEELQFSESELAAFSAENKKLKEDILKTVDPEDLERRKGQDALIKEIKGRFDRQASLVKQV
jgi:Sulfotransferase family